MEVLMWTTMVVVGFGLLSIAACLLDIAKSLHILTRPLVEVHRETPDLRTMADVANQFAECKWRQSKVCPEMYVSECKGEKRFFAVGKSPTRAFPTCPDCKKPVLVIPLEG